MKSRLYIRGLDGLRAISIAMVLAQHMGAKGVLPQSEFWQYRFWALCFAGLGVNSFFVISGFLISFILLREREEKSRIDLPRFFARRVLRLAPALGLFLLINAVLMKAEVLTPNWGGLFLSLFYLMNFAPLMFSSATLGHLWSLAVEEQFYLIWPFILFCLPPRKAGMVAFGLIGFSVFMEMRPLDAILDVQASWLRPVFHISGIDPALYVGKYGHYFTEGRYFHLAAAFEPGRWTIPAIGCILIGAAAALLERIYLRHTQVPLRTFLLFFGVFFCAPLYLSPSVFAVSHMLQAIGTAGFILAIYRYPKTGIVSVLEFIPLRYLGRISYGLYLWQGLFVTSGPGSQLWFQRAPQNLLLSIIIAILSYEFLEKPFLKMKDRIFKADVPGPRRTGETRFLNPNETGTASTRG